MHDKNLLSEFIYNLQLVGPRLYLPQPVIAWSHPVAGFAYDNSLPTKIVDEIKKQHLISEDISSIICILADWEEVLEDEQAWSSNVYYKMPYSTGSTRTLVRQPIFIGDDLPDYRPGPLLGEHSEEILRSLCLGDEELMELHEAGVYNTWEDLKGEHNG